MKSADFYDWVVLGDSCAGQYLLSHLAETIANQPNQHRWRVAWVLPSSANLYYCPSHTEDQLHDLGLQWQAKGIDVVTGSWRFVPDHEAVNQGAKLPLPLAHVGGGQSHRSKAQRGKALQVFTAEPNFSPVLPTTILQTAPKPTPRVLYARHWVAAIGTTPLRQVMNLVPPHYVLGDDLLQGAPPKKQQMAIQVAILGDQPQALPTAQSLAQAGYDVTLLLQQSRLLPEVDHEIAQILQAYLEVQGIKVKICGRLTAVKVFTPHHTRLWLGQTTFDTERLVLSAPPRSWLAEQYQLPNDVLWCETTDDFRRILGLYVKKPLKFDWRSWLARWGMDLTKDSATPHFYQRLNLVTEPPLVHYGVMGEESHRLILSGQYPSQPEGGEDLGLAKIQVSDGKIVGFSGIGAESLSLSHLMGWLIEQEATYIQWQEYKWQQ
ncbi:MAG: NAD-binding protein [Pseudanabaenaceae cyanobacterium]